MNPYVFDNTYFQELLNDNSPYLKQGDDLSLLSDPELRKIVEEFAEDEESFFEAFGIAFAKVSELGQEENMLSEV